MIAIVAILAACQPDPTVVKFKNGKEVTKQTKVDTQFTYSDEVTVSNGKGETTISANTPEGVIFTKDGNKFTISGTFTALGDVKIAIEAKNNNVSIIQNLTIQVTEGSITDPEGDGTKENPYNVAGAIANQVGAGKYVQGFIVGYIKTSGTENEWFFTAEGCDNNTMVILAASPTETDHAKCLPAQLPSGAVRTGLNLVDHPDLVGKEVLMFGSLETYFSVPGLKSVTYAKLIASGVSFGTPPEGNDPTDPDPVATLFEDFEGFTPGNSNVYFSAQTDNKGWFGYATQGILQPDIRTFNNNIYVQFSAHRSSGVTAGDIQEMWAVSPKLNVTAATNKKLNFDIAGGYYNAATIFEIYVLTDKNPATATKTKLTVTLPSAPTSGYGTLAPIGNIDLSSFSGTIRIGFYYKGTSGSGNSTTWQIDNFSFN